VSTIDTSAFRGLFSMHMVVPQLDLLIRPEKMDHAHSPHHAGYLAPYVRAYSHIHACTRAAGGPWAAAADGRPTDGPAAGKHTAPAHACMHACVYHIVHHTRPAAIGNYHDPLRACTEDFACDPTILHCSNALLHAYDGDCYDDIDRAIAASLASC
jgi:hypothetical protein